MQPKDYIASAFKKYKTIGPYNSPEEFYKDHKAYNIKGLVTKLIDVICQHKVPVSFVKNTHPGEDYMVDFGDYYVLPQDGEIYTLERKLSVRLMNSYLLLDLHKELLTKTHGEMGKALEALIAKTKRAVSLETELLDDFNSVIRIGLAGGFELRTGTLTDTFFCIVLKRADLWVSVRLSPNNELEFRIRHNSVPRHWLCYNLDDGGVNRSPGYDLSLFN